MSAVILYRIDSTKRMHRYYRMDVQPDLFGKWCLMREWGGIGSSGQMRSVPFPTPQEAEAALEQQRSAKERRGYATESHDSMKRTTKRPTLDDSRQILQ